MYSEGITMQNSQIAAVATAISAVALGMVLAVPGNAASPAGSETISGSVVPDVGTSVSPAVDALACTADSVHTEVSKHFGTPALNGVSTVADSEWKALKGYLRETGSAANAAPAEFTMTKVTVDRVIFTTVGKATSAIVVDRATPSLWDWRQGASCL
jgi:hypothetical protein